MDQKKEAVNNLAKKLGSIATTIVIAGMDNGIGRFVRNQLNAAIKFEEEKLLKEKIGNETEELE